MSCLLLKVRLVVHGMFLIFVQSSMILKPKFCSNVMFIDVCMYNLAVRTSGVWILLSILNTIEPPKSILEGSIIGTYIHMYKHCVSVGESYGVSFMMWSISIHGSVSLTLKPL